MRPTSGGWQLRQKLFRLKNMDQLQDTEENTDDSELKVGIFFEHLIILLK